MLWVLSALVLVIHGFGTESDQDGIGESATKPSYDVDPRGTLREFELVVSQLPLDDGSVALAYNGQVPGPTLRAKQYDTVVVKLVNHLVAETTSVHWHGILQRGTPQHDGVPMLTQWPVLPGLEYTYVFNVGEQAGTYFYHSHSGAQQADGLYGSLIIEKEANVKRKLATGSSVHSSTQEDGLAQPENELLIVLAGGFSSCSGGQMLAHLLAEHWDVESADHIVINGDVESPHVNVTSGSTYRVRIINAGAMSRFRLWFGGHDIVLDEADGHDQSLVTTQALDISSGQRYAGLLEVPEGEESFSIRVGICDHKSHYKCGGVQTALQVNVDGGQQSSDAVQELLASDFPDEAKMEFTGPDSLLGTEPDVVFNFQINSFEPNPDHGNSWAYWGVNNVSYSHPKKVVWNEVAGKRLTPSDGVPYSPVEGYTLPPESQVFEPQQFVISPGQWVRIVINAKLEHSWHLHGYTFYVLGRGKGPYDPAVNEKQLNLESPMIRDTVYQPVDDDDLGWTVIQFYANNPGVWLFHCHMITHHAYGQTVHFVEGAELLQPTKLTYD
jgi:FtsP/CotA-like multicopper oxidase with cupredoxin domain